MENIVTMLDVRLANKRMNGSFNPLANIEGPTSVKCETREIINSLAPLEGRKLGRIMIVYRTWKKIVRQRGRNRDELTVRYICDGWFLLGIIPLYIRCRNIDIPKDG